MHDPTLRGAAFFGYLSGDGQQPVFLQLADIKIDRIPQRAHQTAQEGKFSLPFFLNLASLGMLIAQPEIVS
ncbi:hypothetical protein [Desulfosarcina cetonica]